MQTIQLTNQNDFNLTHIFECGQCFRWKREEDGSYTGVVKNGVINIRIDDRKVIQLNCELIDEDTKSIIQYFDLERDYAKIRKDFSRIDFNIKNATQYGEGIRILKQDAWEMLISFIISAANNIPRISKTIENISMKYGKPIFFQNRQYYLFPTPEELAVASMEDLRNLNLGFRDKYVYKATQKVVSKEIDLEVIKELDYDDAKRELMKIDGVGEKVADCILLFSMNKMEAFPIDTWIKKVMMKLYGTSGSQKEIKKCAQTTFGAYAGIAQQYLFYYMREMN